MLRRLARFFLAAAFLAAQTAGVAHQAWHDAAPVVAHADEATDGKAPQKSLLCDFHTALSAVLGALNGGSHASVPDTQVAVGFATADVPAARFSGFAPLSRAPPSLL